MIISPGYAVSAELEGVFTPEIYSEYYKRGKLEFKRVMEKWVSGSGFELGKTPIVEELTKLYGLDTILITSFVEDPDKLIEPEGFETHALGNVVIVGSELQYGMSGFKN